MATKITTPELFNLSSNNTAATQLPVFTASTRPTPTASTVQVEYLVIGGGGAGGGWGGGGGAGGYLTNYGGSKISLTSSVDYAIAVGEGGIKQTVAATAANSGEDSSIIGTGISITATGGGAGGTKNGNTTEFPAQNGGSGGGASAMRSVSSGGSGTTGQGEDGGNSPAQDPNFPGGGGGGGASSVGGDGQSASGSPAYAAGNGGDGLASSITGTSVTRAGGGGGFTYGISVTNVSSGGTGGGGAGGRYVSSGNSYNPSPSNAVDGQVNTGSGGGSGSVTQSGSGSSWYGGDTASGGSGIVILRYPTNSSSVIKTTGSLVYTESTDGSDTVIQFTEGSGNVSFASAGIAVGEMIFNSTTEKVEYWDGFQWNMIEDEAVAPPIEPNQILWLDANNANSWTGSGSTWFDVSGNGYDATITTAVPSTGTVNGATYLNIPSSSRADYFKIPYSTHSGALNMTSGNVITWLYWMRLPNIPTSVNGLNILLKATPTGLMTDQVYLRYYDPSIEGFNFFVYDANGAGDINPGYIAQVNNNDWFMFVAIYNYPANNFQFHRYQPNTTTYNNTALGNVSPQITGNSDIYLISEPAASYGGYGELGEIRAYDTTFTTAEITAKYNAQKGKYGIT